MANLKKVLKGLESCVYGECAECPYCERCSDAADFVDLAHDALELLEAQQPRVIELKELDFYDPGLYVETRNGCPEGLTDELWPALCHLYCVSENGECGYVSFVNWNADTYDFLAKDYNVEFRCWTSCPTDEQRAAVKWDE